MLSFLQLTRNFSTTTCLLLRRLSKRSNPGLGHQINAIEDAVDVIQSDPEGFAGLESDLMNAHKSHKQHELELIRQKEKIRQYIVKNKYFRKERLPNLLTYAEKEQIKILHSSDNEEWTIEKLAESFPASSETICKILKAHWNPISEKRIRAHDANVLKNWERFKKGEYTTKISAELYEHLKKFVERDPKDLKILQNSNQTFQKKQWQKPKSNEFSSIIMSLGSKTNESETTLTSLSDGKSNVNLKKCEQNNDDSGTYLLGEIKNKKLITMHELKKYHLAHNNENLPDKNADISLDQVAVQKLNNTSGTGIVSDIKNSTTTKNSTNCFDYTEKFASNEVVINEVDRKRYGITTMKDRIHIPRKLWRKGATFRAYDCYYDDDGEFLYRVPGMTSK